MVMLFPIKEASTTFCWLFNFFFVFLILNVMCFGEIFTSNNL
jgi:hypothetical protein